MSAHSMFSPSSAERWMQCPASAKINHEAPRTSSPFAEEGTLAHELAEICLQHGLDPRDLPDWDDWSRFPQDMREHVADYVEFVNDVHHDVGGSLKVEERVDLGEWVEDCWGTADVVIEGEEEVVVIDLKYGQGVRVEAVGNPQLALYALGKIGERQRARVFIYQPRKDHISEATYQAHQLYELGLLAGKQARKALEDSPPFAPNEEACRWCAIRSSCRARADHALKIAAAEFSDPTPARQLTLEEVAALLPKLKTLTTWCKDVEAYALESALAGNEVPGYKVVEARANRRWVDDAANLIDERGLGELLLRTSPVTLTEATKLVKKEVLEELIYKPQGKPTLVPESDKRPAMQSAEAAANDFADN